MPPRKPRSDAARNREAALTAAETLFAREEDAARVTMDAVAAAAGVGKGTLFRAFTDRDGLILALVDRRSDALRARVEGDEPPLGRAAPPRERVVALLDALVTFKLDNRRLVLALEQGGAASPFRSPAYGWWHGALTDAWRELGDPDDAPFLAHLMLAAVRADLIEHLTTAEGRPPAEIRDRLTRYARSLMP
ncbi:MULTISPECIES: TetR/AcrR family transcriptional regulator [Streptomyces]|uniref:TetR/AcrR family transcriptional regulator n=1 Tax=Streptomyces ramulosus TaxID=47762 RepID=A0ABW1FIW5_9ACTN